MHELLVLKAGSLNNFLPIQVQRWCQANFFECGGLAIGISISHKVGDGSTLGKFIRRCAAIIALGSTAVAVEMGATASRFPPLDFLNSPVDRAPINFVFGSVVKRRLVLDAPKIASLKFLSCQYCGSKSYQS
ncbi:BAHD acyltransferase [Pyrus ussuriensis x Pyrus communis]|uniref:BAHD acyltransferase n=1 Tax=Pyrus ussuriensis x Pyrus communis TaxID=2448454 RepID=A0A5N5FRZ3_9ROSA|nr:BAHD acyltransferase [Pyrus ussuriensis x Pyrus communis]